MLKKILGLLVIIAVAGYIWYEKMGRSFDPRPDYQAPVSDEVECTVQKTDCAEMAITLNTIRPTRYYQAVGKLLGVSETDTTLYREGSAMVSVLPSQTKIVHDVYANGDEKGIVTFIFPDGGWVKYDARGNLLGYED